MQRLRYTLPMVDVAVIAGSASDGEIVSKATSILEEEGITYDFQVISAHRNPEELTAYVKNSEARVFITVAGLSAALPGVVASLTEKPVIGVPVAAGTLGGLDALLAIVPDAPWHSGSLRWNRKRSQRRSPCSAHPEGII